jgi:hypothetical protein
MITIPRSSVHSERDAEADLIGVPFGVEAEEAGEDFVAEGGGPGQAAMSAVPPRKQTCLSSVSMSPKCHYANTCRSGA